MVASAHLETRHFVEDMGLFFEQMGFPRMAGRILGVLLTSDPPAQSIPDLTRILKASKSSISTTARLLVERGLIERVPSPVPRRDYFRFKPGGWTQLLREWLQLMAALHQITERGQSLVADQPLESRRGLCEAHAVFSFLEQEWAEVLRRWETDLSQHACRE